MIYLESNKNNNLDNVGSKDIYQSEVYVDKMFGRIKENEFEANLLKEMYHDMMALMKTKIESIQNQPSKKDFDSII